MRIRMIVAAAIITTALAPRVSSVGAQSTSSQSTSIAAIDPARSASSLTVGVGDRLILQLETPLHTRSTREGDRAHFRASDEVVSGGRVAIPRGSEVRAIVTKVRRPGRVSGRAELGLRFEDVRLPDGTVLPLNVSIIRAGFTQIQPSKDGEPQLKGEGSNGGSLMAVGQGGLQGAILGASMGGGKGALYGGAAGAAVGLAAVLLQRGPHLDLPRDMLFELKFDRALSVPADAAQRATQLARSVPSSTVSVPGNPSTSSPVMFPSDNAEPVPDFSKDETPDAESAQTTTVASTKGTAPPVALPPSGTPGDSVPTFEDDDANGFKLKVDVQLVTVDATVRDRSGRPMETLRQEDFRIFENGIEQSIQSFSRDEYPLAVALVVDRSGSVAPYLNELRHAAYRSLSQLKRGDQVCLFTFAGDVQRLEDLTADRQRIANRISTIQAGGGTNIIDALFESVYYLSAVARDRRRVVILVSDNVNSTKPRSNPNHVVRMAMESETVVYSIKTAGEYMPVTMRIPTWAGGLIGKDDGSVSKIAKETGGEVFDVVGTGSLDSALGAAIMRLKLRYTLGYQSTNASKDGSFRKIDVRLADRYGRADSDYSVSSRRGYYSAVEQVAAKAP
jgi:Ca-activated chloride channel family protein